MTYEGVCKAAEWRAENKGQYIWYIKGGELDGTYYRSHFPQLIDEYESGVQLWWWEE